MSVISIFREALQALRFNRQRSILTTISLAWGVACFVILYSYGDGFHVALQVAFRQVGQDLVLMFGGQTSTQAGGERAGRKVRLELTDVDAIRHTVPLAATISPEMMMGAMTIIRGYRTNTTMVRGVLAPTGASGTRPGSGPVARPEDEIQKRRVLFLAGKPPRSCSARSHRRTKRSPSAACVSRSSAC